MRIFICLRNCGCEREDDNDHHCEFYGGKIIVANDEDEAKRLFTDYYDGYINPDNEQPLRIIDVTDKLDYPNVLYDNPCR